MPVEEQVLVLFAAVNGYLDDLELGQLAKFEQEYLKYIKANKADIITELKEKGAISDELKAKLQAAIESFKKIFA